MRSKETSHLSIEVFSLMCDDCVKLFTCT